MKILITNIQNTYNYGTMMMAENLISYLNKYLISRTDIEYFTDISTTDNLERLKIATEYDKIYMDKHYTFKLLTRNIRFVRIIEKWVRDYIAFSIKKCKYDVIIVLGGDDFAETYYEIPRQSFAVINTLKRLKRLNESSKLFMIGQTIGPYTR